MAGARSQKMVVAKIGAREVPLSLADAKAWRKAGFARWIGRDLLLITARFNPRGDVRGFSAVFGEALSESGDEWAVMFRREQLLKREMELQQR
jgi:hypothetical protein